MSQSRRNGFKPTAIDMQITRGRRHRNRTCIPYSYRNSALSWLDLFIFSFKADISAALRGCYGNVYILSGLRRKTTNQNSDTRVEMMLVRTCNTYAGFMAISDVSIF